MTKNKLGNLLDELQNDEAYIRNDAIKKIIKGKINDENIIAALKDVIDNDPSIAVRNFARSALNIFGFEHSAFEEPVVIKAVTGDNVDRNKEASDEIHVTENPLALRLLTGLYILAFIPVCFCATQAGYIFDGGYTPENRAMYRAIVSFPITILVSVVGMWWFYSDRKYYAVLLMAILPVIHFIFLLLNDE